MGNTSEPVRTKPEERLVDKFIEWLNAQDMEQKYYTDGMHDIISECNLRLHDELPDETSRD